jgi:molecular chaperone HscB
MPESDQGETKTTTATCWKCGAPRPGIRFCACGALQPPPQADYFTVLDLPHKLSLDPAALEKSFHALSWQLHPDKFAQRDEREQEFSLRQAALLNDAYRALRDPVSRAEYLLKLSGATAPPESRAARQPPPDLLGEVFALNETLDEFRGGAAELRVSLEEARGALAGKLRQLDAELQAEFRVWDEAPGPAPLQRIRASLDRRSYLANLLQEIGKALE